MKKETIQYPIDQLDRLLTETIHPDQFVVQPLMEGQISNYIETVRTAQVDIRQFLWRKASKARDLIAMERLVSLYQASIIRLLDTLYQYQLNITGNTEIQKCYQAIYQELEALLGYIERYFPHFINYQQKVPDGFLSASIQQLCWIARPPARCYHFFSHQLSYSRPPAGSPGHPKLKFGAKKVSSDHCSAGEINKRLALFAEGSAFWRFLLHRWK